MATFILVHGSCHGGWCWEKVVSQLEQAGHRALAPDLPGLGGDRTPAKDVTLAMTGRFVADLAETQAENVILVGHSLGGLAISDAAERAPDAIAGLVFVTAALLPNGGSAMGMMGEKLPDGISLSSDGSVLVVDPDFARERWYSGCEEDDIRRALARVVPQPIQPMRDPLVLTSGRFGNLPRAYIECVLDNAIPLSVQRSLREALPCDPVFTMETGHSPFMQNPQGLTAHLLAAACAFTAPARLH